ncbi:MAG: bifunctional 5,10-methylenetetrahydrofolate dehydrogenase/5,10-methenyltetrahydrofolate cyclohydrolase [Patescibacteria group bacterium]
MLKKIDGRAIAEKIKDGIAREIFQLQGARPNLAIILVGKRPDSQIYVSLKQKEGAKVGVDTHLYQIEAAEGEAAVLATINFLNQDPLIDGILVQLPLPEKFNTDKIIAAIDPEKDADGFHPERPDHILSPVLSSISACLDEIKFQAAGKTACVLYNSEIFGQSVKELLETKGMTVSLKDRSEKADLLVTALGAPHQVKKTAVKEDAVIIDIGITPVGGEVRGDVDYEDVKDKASFITPVPGGIGPMTVAFLLRNVLEIYKRRHQK